MRESRPWLGRAGWALGVACLAPLCAAAGAETTDALDLPPPPSLWFRELNFRTAIGYHDNVSLASVAPAESGFISTGLEAFASRLPMEQTSIDFFLLFDDIHYFRSDPVELERLGFVQLTVKQDLSEIWQASIALDYLYQNQVLDVSTTEANLDIVQVEGHGVVLRPAVRLQLHPRAHLSFDYGVARQFFRAPLDDYWEAGPRFSFTWNYGHRSEVSATFETNRRFYDHYRQLDSTGATIARTERRFLQQELKLNWRHYYDAKRRWRSTLKFALRTNQDNGSGYFDYTRVGGGHQLLLRAAGWEARADLGYYHYHYGVQRINGPASPKRERNQLNLSVRLEKELLKYLKAYAEYEHEKTTSNERFFDYGVNIVTGGLIWIF